PTSVQIDPQAAPATDSLIEQTPLETGPDSLIATETPAAEHEGLDEQPVARSSENLQAENPTAEVNAPSAQLGPADSESISLFPAADSSSLANPSLWPDPGRAENPDLVGRAQRPAESIEMRSLGQADAFEPTMAQVPQVSDSPEARERLDLQDSRQQGLTDVSTASTKDDLIAIVSRAGLLWVETSPQEESYDLPTGPLTRPVRERKPRAPVSSEPLVQVETRPGA
ncbi:MAG: hypothetical protein VW339_08160, partial [Quisquiliibacterium sp.]